MTDENRSRAHMSVLPKQSIGRLRLLCQRVTMNDGPQLGRRRAERSEVSRIRSSTRYGNRERGNRTTETEPSAVENLKSKADL